VETTNIELKVLSVDMDRLTKQVEKLVESMQASFNNDHRNDLRHEQVLSKIENMIEAVKRAHSRIDILDLKASDYSTFKTKAITYGTVGSVALAFFSQFILKHFA
jgi:predicted RNase H-like nuclease (RuvC/YqgF family)